MATRRYYWLKLSDGFFNRNDIRYLCKQEKGCAYVLLYIRLMLMGINDNGALYFKRNIPFNKSTLAMVTETEPSFVEEALGVYGELGMIECGEDGVLRLCDYEDMVGSESLSASKMRRKRARDRNGSQCDPIWSHCDIEIEKEIDIDKDKDIDIDIEKEREQSSHEAPTQRKERPTIEEVRAYSRERGEQVDAERFYDHYTAVGWMMGGQPMVDWRAAFRKWEKTERSKYPSHKGSNEVTSAGTQSRKGSFDEDEFWDAALKNSYGDDFDRFK